MESINIVFLPSLSLKMNAPPLLKPINNHQIYLQMSSESQYQETTFMHVNLHLLLVSPFFMGRWLEIRLVASFLL